MSREHELGPALWMLKGVGWHQYMQLPSSVGCSFMKYCVSLFSHGWTQSGLDRGYIFPYQNSLWMNLSLVQHIRHWQLPVPGEMVRPLRSCPTLWCVSVLRPPRLHPHHPQPSPCAFVSPHLLSLPPWSAFCPWGGQWLTPCVCCVSQIMKTWPARRWPFPWRLVCIHS